MRNSRLQWCSLYTYQYRTVTSDKIGAGVELGRLWTVVIDYLYKQELLRRRRRRRRGGGGGGGEEVEEEEEEEKKRR